MEGNSDFVSSKVQSVHMAAALTGCLLRVSPFETGGENKLQMALFRGRGQGYMGLIFLLHCENQSQTLTFSAQLLVFCASTHRDLLCKKTASAEGKRMFSCKALLCLSYSASYIFS